MLEQRHVDRHREHEAEARRVRRLARDRAPRAARPLAASTAAAVPEPPPKEKKAPAPAADAEVVTPPAATNPPVDPPKETPQGEVGESGGPGVTGNPVPPFETTAEAKAPEAPKDARKSWEVTEDLLMSAKVPLNDFFQWLETTGRVKDGSIFTTVSETPAAVLEEILKDNCAALRKCIRLYGA